MVEFEKQEAKQGFQDAVAKYIGLLEEPLEGEKNGKKWRKVKMQWQIETKSQPNRFVMWCPLSEKSQYKSDNELKQFDTYRIVWVEENVNYKGKEWVEKKLVIIKDHTSENENQAVEMTEKEGREIDSSYSGIKLPDKDKVIQDYVDIYASGAVIPPEDFKGEAIASVNHFIGTIIKSHCPENKDAVKYLEEIYNNKVLPLMK